jgi:hypothetical protein
MCKDPLPVSHNAKLRGTRRVAPDVGPSKSTEEVLVMLVMKRRVERHRLQTRWH